MAENPQFGVERRLAARHLLEHPLTVAESDPELFSLIRRHDDQLDQWFTQRFGYRLQVTNDTARLSKSGWVPDRPLRTTSGRAFHHAEYTLLVLTLAATIAGPAVVSLRDLIDKVRTAGADAGVDLADDGPQRRAQVNVLRWMIDHGLAEELHDQIDAYRDDAEADAVLRTRPDRIALLPLATINGLGDDADAESLLAAADRRSVRRTWLRSRLAEDPVIYRDDLDDDEWEELRRRRSEDAPYFEEMFGLEFESRAEGVAAIDPEGKLSDVRFPTSGTEAHAALLLIAAIYDDGTDGAAGAWLDADAIDSLLVGFIDEHRSRWRNVYVDNPAKLRAEVCELLCAVRLAEVRSEPQWGLRLLAGAGRFRHVVERRPGDGEQLGLL